MTGNVFATLRNAVSNASRRPVGDDEIGDVLRTGTGAGHVVRAVFGDCALDTLVEAAWVTGLSLDDLLAAYRIARSLHAAAHDGLDAMAAEAERGFGTSP